MARFVLFGTHGGLDIVVNTDHVIAVDQVGDSTQEGQADTCRLWLSEVLWTDEDGEHGQDYVDVVGCLFEVHRLLNGEARP